MGYTDVLMAPLKKDLLMLVDYPSANTDDLQAALKNTLEKADIIFSDLQGAVRIRAQLNFDVKPSDKTETPEDDSAIYASDVQNPECVVYIKGVLRSQAQAAMQALRENFIITNEDFDPNVENELEIGSDSADWWLQGPQDDED